MIIATDEDAKEYLVQFMHDNFQDRTFSEYIRTRLAGDFAYQLANAIASFEEGLLDQVDGG